MEILERDGRVSRSDAALGEIVEAANQTEAITSIVSDIQPFLQEYGMVAVHLRGLHRKTGLVVIIKLVPVRERTSGAMNSTAWHLT